MNPACRLGLDVRSSAENVDVVMIQTTLTPGTSKPTTEEAAQIEGLYRSRGLAQTCALLGVSRGALDRLRGALPVRPSTLFAVRVALGMMAPVPTVAPVDQAAVLP